MQNVIELELPVLLLIVDVLIWGTRYVYRNRLSQNAIAA